MIVITLTIIFAKQAITLKREVNEKENLKENFKFWIVLKQAPQYRYLAFLILEMSKRFWLSSFLW